MLWCKYCSNVQQAFWGVSELNAVLWLGGNTQNLPQVYHKSVIIYVLCVINQMDRSHPTCILQMMRTTAVGMNGGWWLKLRRYSIFTVYKKTVIKEHSINANYVGCSINKLQYSIILFVFQILKIRNIRILGNLTLIGSCEFYDDDVTVTLFINIKYGDVATKILPLRTVCRYCIFVDKKINANQIHSKMHPVRGSKCFYEANSSCLV